MRIFNQLSQEFVSPMEKYREWVFSGPVQKNINGILAPRADALKTGENSCSAEFLRAMDHSAHDGLPGDFVGINLNSQVLKLHVGQFDGAFINEARKKSEDLDAELQDILGAKIRALKMYYPPGGFIQWHTNWDAPGYNVIFTHSQNGKGYWRHVDPSGSTSLTPNLEKLVHVDDRKGWHGKAGYFGAKNETDRVMWHSAYTAEPRLTLSYLIYEKALWENLVDELTEMSDG